MSHLFKQGMFVREPAWHGLGVVLDEYPGRDEAMRLAGHDHQIVEQEIALTGVAFGSDSEEPYEPEELRPLESYKALTRNDTGEIVSVVPAAYPVIQNGTPWDLIDDICQVEAVRYETAGILGGAYADGEQKSGTVYWVLAHLDEPALIGRDPSPVYPFILGTWAHDRTQALRLKETGVRVVCANTQSWALAGAGNEWSVSFRHAGNVGERIAEAKFSLDKVREAHQAFVEVANELANLEISEAGVARFVEYVLPLPELAAGQAVLTDRQVNNVEKARDAVRALLDGPTCDGVRNTAWGLVQAGVEYNDHVRRSFSKESLFKRNLVRVEAAKAGLEIVARQVAVEFAV